jgi:hypothetical protein
MGEAFFQVGMDFLAAASNFLITVMSVKVTTTPLMRLS